MHTIAPTTVTCPYCDAKPGAPCRTATGNIARTHADRVRVASAPDEVTVKETVEKVTDSDVDTLMSITHHKVAASDWSDQTTEGAMRRQEARDQANDLARTLTGPARRLLWATADGIDHLQAVLHDHGITPTTIEETTIDFRPTVQDDDKTFTLDDVAIAARHKTKLPHDVVFAAAQTYLAQMEKVDGRDIDPDEITENDADFLIQSIEHGHAAGDLASA